MAAAVAPSNSFNADVQPPLPNGVNTEKATEETCAADQSGPVLAWQGSCKDGAKVTADADGNSDGQDTEKKKSVSQALLFGLTDPEVIKAKVRTTLEKTEPYSVFIYYHETGFWQAVAKHPVFENLTLTVIALNAVYIAIDTDWNKDKPLTAKSSNSLTESAAFFQFMEHLFCVYFFGEWITRFMAFKHKLDGRKDGWFVFDSILVLMMVAETWVLLIIMAIIGGDGESPIAGLGMLRLLRLLRLSRLMKMLKSLPELMILIKGMIQAMTSVAYVMALLMIVTYIFGIAFTQLAVGKEIAEVYFTNVPLSMYSLLIHATFLDDLSGFLNSLREQEPLLLVFALVFICLAALTLMNMLIGVLCEVVSAVAEIEKEQIVASTTTEKLEEISISLDNNFDGKISYQEFCKMIDVPEALQLFREVGVCPVGMVDFAELFFFDDGEAIELSFPEFMEMVLDLRDSNKATVKDILGLWMRIKTITNRQIKDLHTSVRSLDKRLDRRIDKLTAKMNEISDKFEGQILTVVHELRCISTHVLPPSEPG